MSSSSSSDRLAPVVERFSAIVDDRLSAIIDGEEQFPGLHEGMRYALGLDLEDKAARGKRLRPVLCMATCEALGGDPAKALGFACAIELMHNFALVHDDIEDGDTVRRDRPCVHIRYGLAHGINIGDYLLCKVLSTLLDDGEELGDLVRLRLLRLMSETLDHTHIGQCLDIGARDNRAFTHEDYLRLVREKTGHYLAAPMIGGAIVAGADQHVLTTLEEFGHYTGPLFQITDDTLDLTAGKGRGGRIGSDIREGKRSFLVAETTSRATEADRAALYAILEKPREETTDGDVAAAIALFEKWGAVESAREACSDLLEKALRSIRTLPAPLEGLLACFARSLTERRR